jgi:hypothetical protein
VVRSHKCGEEEPGVGWGGTRSGTGSSRVGAISGLGKEP